MTYSYKNNVRNVEKIVNKYCDAQGKGRGKGCLREVTQRSFIDGRWWMVDILSLMLYIKFGFAPYTRLLRHKYKKPPPQFSN